jgi:hypothetical protein
MSFISDFLSLIGGVYHLLIAVPILGIGILVGGFGYRWLLQKNPTLLANLVASVGADISTLTTDAEKAAASTTAASATVTTLPSTYGSTK